MIFSSREVFKTTSLAHAATSFVVENRKLAQLAANYYFGLGDLRSTIFMVDRNRKARLRLRCIPVPGMGDHRTSHVARRL